MNQKENLAKTNKLLLRSLLKKKLLSRAQAQEAFQQSSQSESTSLAQYLLQKKWIPSQVLAQEIKLLEKAETRIVTTSGGQKNCPSESTVVLDYEKDVPPRPEKKRFANYEVIDEIARGGMGVVYRAKEVGGNKVVALKVLLGGQSLNDSIEVKRFFREAQAASSLSHPNVVRIHTVGTHENHPYLVMDYIEGSTFHKYLEEGKPWKVTLPIIAKIARALHLAHKRNIIHRDIKPCNILISKEGEPYLSDFGLAKKTIGENTITQSGTVLGTPFYMSPEQVEADKKIDHRTDIYALGIMIYQCLTQKRPYDADSLASLYQKITNETPPSPRSINNKISPALETICLRAIEKKRSRRYQSSLELARDIEMCLSPKRGSRNYKRKFSQTTFSRGKTSFLAIFSFVLFFSIAGFFFTKNYLGDVSFEEKQAAHGLREKAEAASLNKDWAKAEILYQEIIDILPQKEIYLELGNILAFQDKFSQAKEALEKGLQYAPKEKDPFYYALAQIFFTEKQYKKALQYSSYILKKNPKDIPAHRLKEKIYQKMGLQAQASQENALIKTLVEESWGEDIQKAKELFQKKEYTAALGIIKKAEEKFGSSLLGWKMQSKIFQKKQKWLEAITSISQVIQVEPQAENYLFRANLLLKTNQLRQAEKDLEKILLATPLSLELENQLRLQQAELALLQKDYSASYQISRKLLPHGKNPKLLLIFAQAAYFLEKYKESLDYLNQIFALSPEEEIQNQAKMYLGLAYYRLDQKRPAIDHLKSIIDVPEVDQGQVLAYLGTIYLEMGELTTSYSYLEKAQENFSHLPIVQEKLAQYYLQKGDVSKAKEAIENCLQLIPWEPRYHLWYGQVLTKEKKFSQAEFYFKRSLELNPGELSPLVDFIMNRVNQGKLEEILEIPTIYNTHLATFFVLGEPRDLFRDKYNILDLQYRQAAPPQTLSNYDSFFKSLEEENSPEVLQVAFTALTSFSQDNALWEKVKDKVSQHYHNPSEKTVRWVDLSKQLEAKREQENEDKIRRLVVRLMIGKDPQAFPDLDKWGGLGEDFLQKILEHSEENMIMRFLAARTLLKLGTTRAFQIVERYGKNSDQLPLSVLCAVALKKEGFPVAEQILIHGLALKNTFLRALCALHVKNIGFLTPLLEDADERVQLYAANRFLSAQSSSRNKSLEILVKGCRSENPFVRIYSCASLWPKKMIQETQTLPSSHIKKYQSTLIQLLQDPHPQVRRAAALRVGAYRIESLSSYLLPLIKEDKDNVRFQALMSLGWLRGHNKIFLDLVKSPEESFIVRSTSMTSLLHNRDFSVISHLDKLLQEKNPTLGILTIGFMGAFGGQLGPIVITRYLEHHNPLVRGAVIGGLIFQAPNDLNFTLPKLLQDKSLMVQQAAASALIRIIIKNKGFGSDLKKLHKKMQTKTLNIKFGAAFGYYFPIYYGVFSDLSRSQFNQNDIENYDTLKYQEVTHFLYEYYYLKLYQKRLENKSLREQYYQYLTQAISLLPSERYYLERSLISEKELDLASAIADLEKAIQYKPKRDLAYNRLVALYYQTKQYDKALQMAEEIIQKNPRNGEGWKYKEKSLLALGKKELAKEAAYRSYILDPKSPRASSFGKEKKENRR